MDTRALPLERSEGGAAPLPNLPPTPVARAKPALEVERSALGDRSRRSCLITPTDFYCAASSGLPENVICLIFASSCLTTGAGSGA